MYRDRRTGIRRLFEIHEVLPLERGDKTNTKPLFRWSATGDSVKKSENSVRCNDILKTFTRMSEKEMKQNLTERESVLKWMVKKDINTVEGVGEIISMYYTEPEALFKKMLKR
jgi:hypothetical protein